MYHLELFLKASFRLNYSLLFVTISSITAPLPFFFFSLSLSLGYGNELEQLKLKMETEAEEMEANFYHKVVPSICPLSLSLCAGVVSGGAPFSRTLCTFGACPPKW